MKITCDQCGAVYRIPEEKLTKDVSRATCKKCGAKLIIRRPAAGEEGYEDSRLAGGHGGDDESVINHEERTVIAQVPELQKFDATPPLAAGAVASPDELRAMMNNAPAGQPVINSRTTIETYDQTVAQPRRIGEQGGQGARAANPAPKVNTPPTPTVVPPITANTSPQPPSGREAAAAASSPAASAVPTPSMQPAGATQQKANVVDIFAQQNRPGGQAQDFQQPASKLSLVLLIVALIGILLFIPQGLWGLTKTTAIGFHVALYGILAAIMAQWDLTSTGRVNMVKVFLVPAVICGGLLAVLWKTQSEEIAFLHPELDLSIVKEYIASLPDAPPAERESRDALAEKIKRMRDRRPQTGRAPSGPALPSGDVPALPSDMTTGEAGVTAVASRTGGDANAAINVPTASNPLLGSREQRKLPEGPRQMAEATVQLDEEGIERELSRVRIDSCFNTSARGMDLPGRIELKISIQPDGSARSSRIAIPDTLKGSSLEKCMQDKVSISRFPVFEGKSQTYTKTFVR